MDETWKLSKGRSRSTAGKSSSSKNYIKQQQQQYNQFQEPQLLKSYSHRPSTSDRSPPFLPKSYSQRGSNNKHQPSSSSTRSCSSSYADSDLIIRSVSQKGSNSIGKKCGSLAREQKARFYIIRRCVAMLVCWHDEHVDDS